MCKSTNLSQRKKARAGVFFLWLGIGDENQTFSEELTFEPSELDSIYIEPEQGDE